LICVPNAGGDVTLFNGWAERLPSDVELRSAQLPGRGRRFCEAPLRRMQPILAALTAAWPAPASLPTVLFGHSLGALVVFELAHWMVSRGHAPRAVFLSSMFHPPSQAPWEPIHSLGEREFEAAVRRFNGVPPAVWEDAGLRDLVFARLRSDLEVLDTYEFRPRAALPCPLVVVGGRHDPIVDERRLAAWKAETSAVCSVHVLEGDHFHIHETRDTLLELITQRISQERES
jgi:medium-chain acyl-[acyl-carrier-protein] hydrolase